MKPKKLNDTTMITGEVRLSYPYLFKPNTDSKYPTDKYETLILVPVGDTETIEMFKSCVQACGKDAVENRPEWKRKKPTKYQGVELLEAGENDISGYLKFRAKSGRKPAVINQRKEAITDPEEIYGGVFARVQINFFAWGDISNGGVSAGLIAVQKVRDGEAFGSGSGVALDEFDTIEGGDDEF
ncbi:ssDNA-binding protein [Porphyromonas cangingivalis]|uniref:ssDNA-binding protein n=1 Tax=Porphyromonas cangingivalis TaxID=36874 RepID=UPI00242CB398|nr:ssDNA-binding protein [Porphyromonas cangingivalis]